MTERSASPAAEDPANQRLDSWKAIASYLGRDVTTVQRWERREGLPVHRHVHDKLGSVYAFRREIDDWLRDRRPAGSRAVDPVSDTSDGSPAVGALALSDLTGATPPTRSKLRPVGLWLLLGGAVLGLTVLAWWIASLRSASSPHVLDGAEYQVLSDFEGTESAAAISRDGHHVAFVSDRDGRPDVWVTRVGTGQFYNLTAGRARELLNPDVRTLGFSPDGTYVTFWARGVDGAASDAIGVWAVPTMGGAPRPYLEDAAEYQWDSRAERLVTHSPASGDPTFIQTGPVRPAGAPVFTAPQGRHAHFPTWSPDGQRLYMVLGTVPDALDIFRMDPDGTGLEQVTHHAARVTHPVFLDSRTLLYLKSDGQGAGGTLHALDVDTLAGRSLAQGLERYLSLSASADGRRIVATVANTKHTLWRLPASEGGEPAAARPAPVALPTMSGWAPRHAHGNLVYVTWKGAGHALWSLAGGDAREIWHGGSGRIVGGPAVSMNGRKLAVTVEQEGRVGTIVMNADGTGPREVSGGLAVRGEPDWAPDAESLITGAVLDGKPHVVRLPLAGRPASIVPAFGLNPVWAPDAKMLVYTGPDVGTQFTLAAASPIGTSVALPDITLPRGARRVRFVKGGDSLVVMRGDLRHKDLWEIHIATGTERRLTALPGDFLIRDYDVSRDGREFVLERVQEHSDIVLIERNP